MKNPVVKRLSALIESMPDEDAAHRLKVALKLSEAGLEMKRQQFVREFPNESQAKITQRMRNWQYRRKEAPRGDFPGPTREFS